MTIEPKRRVALLFCMNHWVPHGSRLDIYLRLFDIAVPTTYVTSVYDEDII